MREMGIKSRTFCAVCLPWVALFALSAVSAKASDPVQIVVKVFATEPGESSRILADTTLMVEAGQWAALDDANEITFPVAFNTPTLPEAFAPNASGGGLHNQPDDGKPNWNTHDNVSVIPAQPTEFQKRDYGLKLRLRPRIGDNNQVTVDAEISQTVFRGLFTSGKSITLTQPRAVGSKTKEIKLCSNARPEAKFTTLEKEIIFLPTADGHVTKVLSETLTPEGSTTPKLDISIQTKRLEKRPATNPSKPSDEIHLTVRAVESPEPLDIDSQILSHSKYEMLIRTLAQKKGVDLLSAPSILLRNGQKGKIEVVNEFIYPTSYDPAEVPEDVPFTGDDTLGFPVTPATPLEFTTVETGVTVEARATLLSDGRIKLYLHPSTLEFERFHNFGEPIVQFQKFGLGGLQPIVLTENRIEMPQFSRRGMETTLHISDGDSIVLGGLYREDIQQVEDKVPVLGDLPFIGKLARSETELHSKRYLYFIVTAKRADTSNAE